MTADWSMSLKHIFIKLWWQGRMEFARLTIQKGKTRETERPNRRLLNYRSHTTVTCSRID